MNRLLVEKRVRV